MAMHEVLIWGSFLLFIAILVSLDLAYHRRAKDVSLRQSLMLCAIWIALALGFNWAIYITRGWEDALSFLTGYLIEESLSIDNLFVFLLIFDYFRTPGQYQHKILFWGIMGAIILRGSFILAGIALIQKFHGLLYLFGAFLLYTAIKMAQTKDEEIHPEKNPILLLLRKYLPVTPNYVGNHFFINWQGKLFATPLVIVLLTVETSDVIFALDSIPAIFAITLDPFIVFTSNIFAVLGLRSLFFVLKHLMKAFYYIHYGVAGILLFVGCKMLAAAWMTVSNQISLAIIAGILGVSILASIWKNGRAKS